VPFEVAILESAQAPKYQQIAERAERLRRLQLSCRVIAKMLGVSDKTVARGVAWATKPNTISAKK
jgi:hypothetical protein